METAKLQRRMLCYVMLSLALIHCEVLPKKYAANTPITIKKEVNGRVEKDHCHWVIEESQNIYGMHTIRCAAQKDK